MYVQIWIDFLDMVNIIKADARTDWLLFKLVEIIGGITIFILNTIATKNVLSQNVLIFIWNILESFFTKYPNRLAIRDSIVSMKGPISRLNQDFARKVALKRSKWATLGHPRKNRSFSFTAPFPVSLFLHWKILQISCPFARHPGRAISREKITSPRNRQERIFIVFTSSSTCRVSLIYRHYLPIIESTIMLVKNIW